MVFTCWKSHTCYVCSGGTGIPRFHVSSRGYQPTSPCDTVGVVIKASNRAGALTIFKQRGRNGYA